MVKTEYEALCFEIYSSLIGTEIKDEDKFILKLKLKNVLSKIAPDISDSEIEENKELICYTASLMAAYDYCEKERSIYQRPIRIGDITMKSAVGGAGLKALIKENLALLAPIFYDDKFLFKQMEEENETL